jgi:hypothetical protein
MKTLAPDGNHLHGSGRRVTEPKLKNSFTTSVVNTSTEVVGTIRNTANWAATNALGSKAHRIVPKTKPFLVFRWEKGLASPRLSRYANSKGLFFFKKVKHPGLRKRNGFMTVPLTQLGRKQNFKVTISRGKP